MNLKILFFILMLYPVLIRAQVFFIDNTDSNYIINEKMLSARKDTGCYTVNCISKGDEPYFDDNGILLTPFVFVKAFGDGKKKLLTSKPAGCKSLTEYIRETAIPKLKADLFLRVTDLGTVSRGPDNINVYDSLLIFDGKNYQLITGVVEINYYNLLDFEQMHLQQSTHTIINTKAKLAPFKMVGGFPQIQVGEIDDYPKMYLIKKSGNDYTFSVWSQHDEDSPLAFYREFVYRRGYGIISLKSKWLFYYPNMGMKGAQLMLYDSDQYYYFK